MKLFLQSWLGGYRYFGYKGQCVNVNPGPSNFRWSIARKDVFASIRPTDLSGVYQLPVIHWNCLRSCIASYVKHSHNQWSRMKTNDIRNKVSFFTMYCMITDDEHVQQYSAAIYLLRSCPNWFVIVFCCGRVDIRWFELLLACVFFWLVFFKRRSTAADLKKRTKLKNKIMILRCFDRA